MGGAVLPACCLEGTAVVMKVMAAPSEVFCSHGCTQCPCLQQATIPAARQRPLDTHGRAGLRLLWGRCSFLQGPGVHKALCVPSKSLLPQSCGSSVIRSHWPPKSNSLGVLSPFARFPGWEICCGPYSFLNSERIPLV